MKKVTVNENQRGLIFKEGKFIKVVGAGRYTESRKQQVEILPVDQEIIPEKCTLNTLLKHRRTAKLISSVEVGERQLALHSVNGQFVDALQPGKHAFWNTEDANTFKIIDVTSPEVPKTIPAYMMKKISPKLYIRAEIAEYQKGRLFFDGKFERLLEPGVYYFWRNEISVNVDIADTRLTKMDIVGQEILTQDKVSLRINFVCNYKIVDFVKILTEIDNYEEQIHLAAQLALRDYVGKRKLDEILENKEEMSDYVLEKLREKAEQLYVEIIDAGVKDVILPGEIRDIMNTVLIAEKRAQANVITRREEVASTRSLLNTAKLMDENQTLYKLKELEYIEKICENVGTITLNGSGDVLAQLTSMLKTNK